MEPLDATIHLAFAFDIGYEIDLERARPLLPGESGPLPRRRRTPESIRYRPAPLRRARSTPRAWPCPGGVATTGPPRAELTLFDFGAISLAGRSSRSGRRPAELLDAGRRAGRARPR